MQADRKTYPPLIRGRSCVLIPHAPESTDVPRVEVRNLSKIFGRNSSEAGALLKKGMTKAEIQHRTASTVAVSGIDFVVNAHETFVIMGLSGCGKSTVLRCLNRLIEPTAGEILLDGKDVVAFNSEQIRAARREQMSMVFQSFGLLPHRSVLENAAFGLEIQHFSKHERDRKASESLELVGLSDYAHHRVQSLSGGMQQRVGLARALAAGTDLLLMDEAFSALDPLIRAEMQDELVALQEKMKKTIIFITHDLDEALKLGDRIAIMKDGAIVQIGTPEEVLMHPADQYVRSFVDNVDRTKVLTAGSIMRPLKTTARESTSPRAALRKMRDASIDILFVVDVQGKLVGAIPINALVTHIRHGGVDLKDAIDREIATSEPNAPIQELVTAASQSHHPIAVLDEDRRLLGLATRTAILASMTENSLAKTLHQDGKQN